MIDNNILSGRPRIAVLHEQGLSSYGIKDVFSALFPRSIVHEISAEKLNSDKLSQYDLLILPGIMGEDSIYPDIINHERQNSLKSAIQNNGLILLTICSATYNLFEKMHFLKSDGSKKHMEGWGFVSGESLGPSIRHESPPSLAKKSPLDAAHLIRLLHPRSGDYFCAIEFNGPKLFPNDKLATVFLRHADIPETPASAILKPFGNGLIMGFGSHIEIPLSFSKMTSFWQLLHAQNIDFSAHEPSRLALLNMVKNIIDNHLVTLSKAGKFRHNLIEQTP